MAYIQFKRDQANASDRLLLPVDGVLDISSSGATNLVIKYNTVTGQSTTPATVDIIMYTMVIAATGGATLTRASICKSVTDAMINCGLDGGRNAVVADFKVSSAALSSGNLE